MSEKAVINPLNTYTNNKTLDIQELGIVLSAKNLNPQMINPDFLKISGVLPNDWELDKNPVVNNRVVQLSFKNGVSIVAQFGSVTFSQSVNNKNDREILVAEIASKYLEKLPNAEYQGVSISPKNVIAFGNEADAGKKYIVEQLLAPGAWHNIGQGIIQANLNLAYQMPKCQFNLSINQVNLQQPDKPTLPGLLFAGSFNYPVIDVTGDQLIAEMKRAIANWSDDLKTFQEVINQKFLGEPEALFPSTIMDIR
jgi:hypothetical protein